VFALTAYITVRDFFYERNNLEMKCRLPQLNVFSFKGVDGTFVISLNY
jgi:hypothetical protein